MYCYIHVHVRDQHNTFICDKCNSTSLFNQMKLQEFITVMIILSVFENQIDRSIQKVLFSSFHVFSQLKGAATVVTSITTLTSNYGEGDEKGKITGIVRSLGALARSFGPLLTCGGEVHDVHSTQKIIIMNITNNKISR